MQRRVVLRLPSSDATAPWRARRAVERLLSAWPAGFLSLLADMDGLRLVVHERDSALVHEEPANEPADYVLTLFLDVGQAAGMEEAACRAAASLAWTVIDLCESAAEAEAAGRYTDFRQRLQAAHKLAYAPGDVAAESPQAYFTWACARYLQDRKGLAGQDPLAYRLLRSTVFTDSFWSSPARSTLVTGNCE